MEEFGRKGPSNPKNGFPNTALPYQVIKMMGKFNLINKGCKPVDFKNTIIIMTSNIAMIR